MNDFAVFFLYSSLFFNLFDNVFKILLSEGLIVIHFKEFFNEFIEQLRRPDFCYLAEIFAARETNTIGISSADLAREIPNGQFFADNAELEKTLRAVASPGDIILTVGAGDVYKIGENLLKQL